MHRICSRSQVWYARAWPWAPRRAAHTQRYFGGLPRCRGCRSAPREHRCRAPPMAAPQPGGTQADLDPVCPPAVRLPADFYSLPPIPCLPTPYLNIAYLLLCVTLTCCTKPVLTLPVAPIALFCRYRRSMYEQGAGTMDLLGAAQVFFHVPNARRTWDAAHRVHTSCVASLASSCPLTIDCYSA